MKNVLLFIVLFFIGVGIAIVIFSYQNSNRSTGLVSMLSEQTSPAITAFSVERAPLNSLKGTITKMTGNIYWESRIASEASSITSVQELQQGDTVIASDDGQLTIIFPSSEIQLTPKTELRIIQTLPVHFLFEQPNGLAEYKKTGTSPLSIRTLRLLTQINEGIFEFSVARETNTITVKVKEGNGVVAYNNADIVSNVINLRKGDEFIFKSDKRIGTLQ